MTSWRTSTATTFGPTRCCRAAGARRHATPLTGEVSITTLTDPVADFIREHGLDGVVTVGQSVGGRPVLDQVAVPWVL